MFKKSGIYAMNGFEGYDIDGNGCRVDEMGNEVGIVSSVEGIFQAVRISSSTYIGTNGKVYSASREKCRTYSTPENFQWAKRQLVARGIQPWF